VAEPGGNPPGQAHAGRRSHGHPFAAIESPRLLLSGRYLQRGRSIPSTWRGVLSAQRVFCPWWPWPLTFDLDIQKLPSEGPNTSSMWIWRQSVQRFVPSVVEYESQEYESQISRIWLIDGRQTITVNSGVSEPKFTKFLHDVNRTSTLLTRLSAFPSVVECESQVGRRVSDFCRFRA